MATTLPDDRRYSREHEWVRVEGSVAVIGITSFAADELGDIVYVELPEVGASVALFASFGVVESVKAVSDLFAPVSGEVSEVNDELRAFDTGTRVATVNFDAPYSSLAWNDATRQLAIAGTSESIQRAKIDARILAQGLFTWIPDAGPPIQIERTPVEALAWTPQVDALVYSVVGEQPELRLWAIGA